VRALAQAVNAYDRCMLPVYIDDHLLVLDKPPGLLSVPGRTEPDCLSARALALWPDALVVHRLDQATSGLFVMARGAQAQRRLGLAFEQRQVHKTYVAVVEGRVGADEGEVTLPLIVDWPNRPRQVVDLANGRPAQTFWQVLARCDTRSLLELRPVTGRSHQLRVHLQALGHPIVGDDLYGTAGPRLLLHATTLDLPHPADDRRLVLHSPVPFAL
jgi:tRNA pseudouridine32 synthase/23S rRNA pseudouridine746 synthase